MSRNYISGVLESGRGPDSPIRKGRGFGLFELGRFALSESAGDKKLHVPLPGRGRIIGAFAVVDEVTTDADADGTLTVEINGSAVTGGVITLADTMTTLNEVFQATAITAGNTFEPNDYVDVAWAVTNAFADGAVTIVLVVEYGLGS